MQGIKSLKGALITILTVTTICWSTSCLARTEIQFTVEEQGLIKRTQQGQPLTVGIIPFAFPLSACPPEVPTFMGMNVEMLELISARSGLKFEYQRIPLENGTPYQELKSGRVQLVAGTIKLDIFMSDPELVLSERFCDGAAVCIARRDNDNYLLKPGKVAVLNGFQAGMEFAQKQFPNHELVLYPNNQQAIKAVRNGEATLAIISRYVGVYELQSPFNENLTMLTPYQMLSDSCIMGLKTKDNQLAISIINKAIGNIDENEANHVQMNFIITNPYRFTLAELMFKNRYVFLVGLTTLLVLGFLTAKLLYFRKEGALLARDQLTGALSEAGFELAVSKIISKSNRPLFIVDFDISHFSSYNELYGKERGDELLKEIVKIVRSFLCEQDAICRAYADNFKVLVCKDNIEALLADTKKASILFNQLVENRMVVKFGIYPITDNNIPIRTMLNFAAMAKKNIKRNPNVVVGVFDTQLHEHYKSDAKFLSMFDNAIAKGEFIAYYQPKFDTLTKKIIGAEALVRWHTDDGNIIPPVQFIELFEQNGLIQRLDFYMLEQVCILQKKLLEQGKAVVPISVNFSRVHLFSSDFIFNFNQIVEEYAIPKHLIEIECTETAMAYDTEASSGILGRLQAQGFKIAMDDFGQAYSSLNTLRVMPLDIVKLDRGFLLATHDDEKVKTIKIIENMVALVHGLSLKMVAEGVETESQYLFLKSIGCDYIQGYYFSRPLTEENFVSLLTDRQVD